MSLTPLEDISCITPQDACITQQDISPGTKSTIKQRPDNDTYGHLTGEYGTCFYNLLTNVCISISTLVGVG